MATNKMLQIQAVHTHSSALAGDAAHPARQYRAAYVAYTRWPRDKPIKAQPLCLAAEFITISWPVFFHPSTWNIDMDI